MILKDFHLLIPQRLEERTRITIHSTTLIAIINQILSPYQLGLMGYPNWHTQHYFHIHLSGMICIPNDDSLIENGFAFIIHVYLPK